LVYPVLKKDFDAMFVKVVRGLYFHEFGHSAEGLRAWARLEPRDRGQALRHVAGTVARQLTPSFAYSYVGDSSVAAWWLDFAGGPTVVATLERQTLGTHILDVLWWLTGSRWP
jgi:hypothetical protein